MVEDNLALVEELMMMRGGGSEYGHPLTTGRWLEEGLIVDLALVLRAVRKKCEVEP